MTSVEMSMQVADQHSHLGGLEFLQVHKPWTWDEIRAAIGALGATELNKRRPCSPDTINGALVSSFHQRQWDQCGSDQRTGFANHLIKDRIGVALQFGANGFGLYDLIAKHLGLYAGDVIDVGVEIFPMKTLQAQMSSGVAYYEAALYNLIRRGRSVPAVPLVLIGVTP